MKEVARVLRLPINEHGRDFVVGDIHGAYDLVLEAMKRVKFDASVDRMLSVGDLVDRGLESARSLKFLRQPYVHAIRGNHEQNLLDIYAGGDPDEKLIKVFAKMFSMQWWLDTSDDVRVEILEQFAALPVAIEVPTKRGLVGLVHGDVPRGMPWQVFLQKLEGNDPAVRDTALEGRSRLLSSDQSGVSGVGRLYVGHSVQRGGPKRYGNVYAVDTGAIFNVGADDAYALTFANVICTTEVLVHVGHSNVPGVIALDETSPNDSFPFGSYAQSAG